MSAGYQLHACAAIEASLSTSPSLLRLSLEHTGGGEECLRFVICVREEGGSPGGGVAVVLLRARWGLDGDGARWEVCLLGEGGREMVNCLPYKEDQLVMLQTLSSGGSILTVGGPPSLESDIGR